MTVLEPRYADLVIVGAGVAGLTAALASSDAEVVVVTKGRLGESGSSVHAQGGIAAALGCDDRPAAHARDTLAAGAGISDPVAVRLLTETGPAAIEELVRLGAELDRGPDGELSLGREAAHSHARIVHGRGDATGAVVMEALVAAVVEAPHIAVWGEALAEDLLVRDGQVVGVVVVREGRRIALLAPAVVLATGGIGQVYEATTNPIAVTGDGLAMAARAGAVLADLEMVQFHPTALAVGRDPMPLATEAIRGEGAILVDGAGERFMPAIDPRAELAPRDVVARAIWRRTMAGSGVYLDARAAVGERFPTRFPTVFRVAMEVGLDPRRDPLPVSPAAHYHMGGVAVDQWGRTSLAGLWAVGEASCSGLHGANRLASNSLLEGLVFGRRVARAVGEDRSSWAAMGATAAARRWREPAAEGAPDLQGRVRRLTWQAAGLERSGEDLSRGLGALASWGAGRDPVARNLVTVARLLLQAALLREESRGAHYRIDHPAPRPEWARHLRLTAAELAAAVEGRGRWEAAG